jgi:hypothetical protein
MRILIVSFLCLSVIIPSSLETKKLSKKDLTILYGPTFKNFKSTGGDYDYGTVRYGDDQYYEGFQGLFNYADYPSDGVNNFLNRKSSNNWGSLEHYEKLAGIKMHIAESADQEWSSSSFHHYNPAFINWLTKNMIPPSGFSIKGVTAKYVYRHYSRFFRLLTESYLYLNKSGTYDQQAKSYIDALLEAKNARRHEDGLDILFGTYHYALSKYEIPSESEIPSPFEPHMAFGFWLRRNLDGTHYEAYKCVSKIMNRFDKRWFKWIKKRYTS